MEYAEYIEFSYRKRQFLNEHKNNKILKNETHLSKYYHRCVNLYKISTKTSYLNLNSEIFHALERNSHIETHHYAFYIEKLFKYRQTKILKYILNNYEISHEDLLNYSMAFGYPKLAEKIICSKNSIAARFIDGIVENLKNTKIIKLLISHEKEYCLVFAARHGFLKNVKYFIENNIDKCNIDKALRYAVRYEQFSVVKYLFKYRKEYKIYNDIIDAIINGKLYTIKFFIKSKLNCISYERIFKIATTHGHIEIMKYILNRVNYSNIFNDNDRHDIIESGNLETIKYLIEDLKISFPISISIDNALGHNKPEIAEYLINFIDNYKFDANLLVRVVNTNEDRSKSINYLLNKNIDIDSVASSIEFTIKIGNKYNIECLANYLISKEYPMSDIINYAKEKKQYAMLKYLKK